MNANFLHGVTTALITPFKNNAVDYNAFERIILKQTDAKVNSLLLFGTTAEPYSLSLSEKKQLFLLAKRLCNNTPLIAGVSSPSTEECLKQATNYFKWKADCLLLTTPYFYKSSDLGVYQHFERVAKKVDLPIIIYNVPSRSNYDITKKQELIERLLKIENIVAIKQALPNLTECKDFLKNSNLIKLCGNDIFTFDLLKSGYSGVISVLSNAFPEIFVEIYNNIKNSQIERAKEQFESIKPLLNVFESIPNPIAIKYLCSKIYKMQNQLRLPLVPTTKTEENQIDCALNKFLGEYKI